MVIDQVIEAFLYHDPVIYIAYLFLPLAHVLTRIVQLFAIDAGGEKLVLKDVLIGDVWVASGQSTTRTRSTRRGTRSVAL